MRGKATCFEADVRVEADVKNFVDDCVKNTPVSTSPLTTPESPKAVFVAEQRFDLKT